MSPVANALGQLPVTLWVSLAGVAISLGALLRTLRVHAADSRQKLAAAVDGVREHAQRHLYLAELMTLADAGRDLHSSELELDAAYREFKSKQMVVGDSFTRQFRRYVAPAGTRVTERSLHDLRGDRTYNAVVAAEAILGAIWNAEFRPALARSVARWRERDGRFSPANLGYPHSGFAAHTDRTPGGLLEAVLPSPVGLRHCSLDARSDDWRCGTIDCEPIPPIDGVSLLQSNFGSGNLEAVVRMGRHLRHYWASQAAAGAPSREPSRLEWHIDGRPDLVVRSADGGAVSAVEVGGHPAFIQSMFGGRGNFEIVAPDVSQERLRHFWRTNDSFDRTWNEAPSFPTPTTLRFEAVALAHVRSPLGIRGTLEVVARSGQELYHFRRIPYPPWGRWEPVPRRLHRDVGPPAQRDPSAGLCFERAAGVPALMQVRTRSMSSADPIYLATPCVEGGIVLLRRIGDDPSFSPWEDEQVVDGRASAAAVSIVQVDTAGTIAVIALVDSEVRVYRQSSDGRWQGAR